MIISWTSYILDKFKLECSRANVNVTVTILEEKKTTFSSF